MSATKKNKTENGGLGYYYIKYGHIRPIYFTLTVTKKAQRFLLLFMIVQSKDDKIRNSHQ